MKDKTKFNVIGKPAQKIDAGIRTTGKAVYGHDIELPGMLYGAILRTKYPAAKIVSIDTSVAEKLPGVYAVITAGNVDVNPISYKRDHPILKSGEVNCIRDEIAAVAADTFENAQKAIGLIKVEYKVREGIFDPLDALNDNAPRINKFNDGKKSNKNIAETFHYEHGNLQEQKAKSACIVKRRYKVQRVTHCCMETSVVTADYSPFDKRLTIYSSTQVPFLFQRDLAHALKMEPSRIRVVQPVIGGGFGSKLDMYPFEPIACLLSMKTGKSVKITFNREEEFIHSPTRQCMVIDLTTGADKNGLFTFREVKIIKDNGAYTSWGATTPFVMMQTFSSLYQLPACVFDSDAVYTNNPNAGSFRGYGNPQASFSLESNIDLMAEELGIDKADIRLMNANMVGEVTGQGLHFKTCGHKQAIEIVLEKSGYYNRDKNQQGRFLRGIGIASMIHVGGGAKIYRSDGCGTTVKLDDYGYLTIITGSTEIGQGSETVLAMIASEELGVSMDHIKVINTDTDVKPWDVGVHASRTTFVAGNSLLGAIKKLKVKLSKKALTLLETIDMDSPDGQIELVYEDNQIKSPATNDAVTIEKVVRAMHFQKPNELCSEFYFYEPPSAFQDKHFKGDVSGSYAFAAQAVELEVDTVTGCIDILDVYMAQDVGRVLNPLGMGGQIEGGIAMGLGYGTTEDLIMENGYVKNATFHNYKLLTACDIPNIHFYPVETHDYAGPYGAKGIGEAPLIPTAVAISNAVSDALGIRIDSLPITPEKILKALKNKG